MFVGEFIRRYPTLRFLKYASIALVVQWAVIFVYIWLGYTLERKTIYPIEEQVLWLFLWPILVMPPSGHSHGGEFFVMPVTAVLYAVVIGVVMAIWKRPRKSRLD